MNDRAISGVLEKYDMEVMRTMKGRVNHSLPVTRRLSGIERI